MREALGGDVIAEFGFQILHEACEKLPGRQRVHASRPVISGCGSGLAFSAVVRLGAWTITPKKWFQRSGGPRRVQSGEPCPILRRRVGPARCRGWAPKPVCIH